MSLSLVMVVWYTCMLYMCGVPLLWRENKHIKQFQFVNVVFLCKTNVSKSITTTTVIAAHGLCQFQTMIITLHENSSLYMEWTPSFTVHIPYISHDQWRHSLTQTCWPDHAVCLIRCRQNYKHHKGHRAAKIWYRYCILLGLYDTERHEK